jgi:hypothetical protein
MRGFFLAVGKWEAVRGLLGYQARGLGGGGLKAATRGTGTGAVPALARLVPRFGWTWAASGGGNWSPGGPGLIAGAMMPSETGEARERSVMLRFTQHTETLTV